MHTRTLRILLLITFMGILILDINAAITGAQEGLELCLKAVIPALFPFFILTKLLTSAMEGESFPILRPIGKLFGIPKGAEFLLLIGLLGGYPVGAQAVTQVYKSGNISKTHAHRLLGFCSNAGPSFIFGMMSNLFTAHHIIWFVWLVHILSALVVGMITAGQSSSADLKCNKCSISLPQALERSIKAIATVCGWVIIFRVIIKILKDRILSPLPQMFQIICIGYLELTNGCCELGTLKNENISFILACAFLASGGLCILMQTMSVTYGLGLGQYIPGKFLQTLISILFASVLEHILFPQFKPIPILIPIICLLMIVVTIIVMRKKSSSIMEKCVV